MMPMGEFVFHRPRVKSGKSIGLLRLATDFSLNSVIQLHVAASFDVDLVQGGRVDALGALHAIDQIVGPGQLSVIVECDGLPADGPDEAGVDVSVTVVPRTVGAHGDGGVEAV